MLDLIAHVNLSSMAPILMAFGCELPVAYVVFLPGLLFVVPLKWALKISFVNLFKVGYILYLIADVLNSN